MARTILDRFNSRYGNHRGFVRLLLAHAEHAVGRLRPYADIDFQRVQRLVFVCRGNICRSCFAEHVARLAGVGTASVGLATSNGKPAYPGALEAARTMGFDLSSHRTTRLQDFAILPTDLLVAMEIRQARELDALKLPGSPQVTLLGLWARPARPHIHDPYSLGQAYFLSCFESILQGTRELASRVPDGLSSGMSAAGSTHEAAGTA